MMHRESFNRRIFGMDSSRHGERIVKKILGGESGLKRVDLLFDPELNF